MLCPGIRRALRKQEGKLPFTLIFLTLTHSPTAPTRPRAGDCAARGSRGAPGGGAPHSAWPPAPALSSPALAPSSLHGAASGKEGVASAPPAPSSAKCGGMFPAQEEADRTVFVGNLEARVREEILYELFLQVPGGERALEAKGRVEPEAQAMAGRT